MNAPTPETDAFISTHTCLALDCGVAEFARGLERARDEAKAAQEDATALLGLVADIRAAVGDPTGKLMQDQLVARCRAMRSALEKLAVAESSGDWGQDLGCVKAIAKQAIE